jgi:hypothetical protein
VDTSKALEIIRALANGVDPHTGEEFSADSPYQHPQIVRALFLAIQTLERGKKASDRQRQLPDNAGKSWSDEEDHRLVLAFDSGKTTKQLADEHKRTEGSIRSRLVKHGKIQI